jgi:hypothetical protein
MHLGRKEGGTDLQAFPDIVARTPGGDVLIGECSLLGPTEQKVGRLLERARSVGGLLRRAGIASSVRAVIFVGEDCGRRVEGGEFVDRSSLREVLERLRSGRPDGQCWS